MKNAHPEALALGHFRPYLQLLCHLHHKHVDDALHRCCMLLVGLSHVSEFAKHGYLHSARPAFQQCPIIDRGCCHSAQPSAVQHVAWR